MKFRFNEAKATQAAAFLLKLRGGKMKYLKLVKLLYILDREALSRWGKPVTTDRYVSMKDGPVVSNIYGLIMSEPMPEESSIWHRHIKTVSDWDVELIGDPSTDELSQAENDLLTEVFATHGRKCRWDLVKETHKFPEWADPGQSAAPITYQEILKGLRKSDEEISATLSEMEAMIAAEQVLQPL